MSPRQLSGTVCWVSPGGGYGMIRPDDPTKGDAYFNRSGVQLFSAPFSTWLVGDRVRFTLIEHPKGPRAIKVIKT